MIWAHILELSWKNLMNRKIRSILTISGVIIGVASITFLVSLGYGFEKMTTSRISSERSFFVFDVSLDNSDALSINQADEIKISEIDGVAEIEPGVIFAGNAILNQIKTNTIINGYNRKFLDLYELRLLRGDFFSDSDENKMIVSTAFLKSFEIQLSNFDKNLFDLEIIADSNLSPSLINDEIKTIQKMNVVGVVDDDQSTFAIIPYELSKRVMATTNFNIAKVRADSKNRDRITEVRSKIESLGFGTNYIGDTIAQINSFFVVFRYIIGGFGVIAMLVAILGMFNTLTVSLLERTREIGVLKSNGAQKYDIWRLFLSEAIIISVIGGFFGIVLGITTGIAVNAVFNNFALKHGADSIDFFYTPVYFILLTVVANIIIGFLVGYYPAKRATNINALDALKYE